ncbi:MAG: polysaccharide biosynthesis tyrosine autokinase [Planctomycetota bacterium]|nr:polysaccharide biosynthesis tyrosine autokinase [Planctomycetota bacterium]
MSNNRLPRDDQPVVKERAGHLADYFAILREHKWMALLPFLLIMGGAVAVSLLTQPVYQAEAVFEIETERAPTSLAAEFAAVDAFAKVDAEIELMRSRNVAERAAKRLASGGLSDFVQEINAHRPLEVMMRKFRPRRARGSLEIRSSALEGRKAAEVFEFEVVAIHSDAHKLEVRKIVKKRFGRDEKTEFHTVRVGEPLVAFGRTFTMKVRGDPRGRVYQMTLRSLDDLTNWVRGRVGVRQLGRKTGVVALSFNASTPRLAQAGAAAAAYSFCDFKLEKKKDKASQAVEFLEERVGKVKTQLDTVEDELNDFRSKNGVTLLSKQATAWVERIAALERDKIELQLKRETEMKIISRLRDESLPARSVVLYVDDSDPTGAELARQITELELSSAALSDALTERHDEMRDIATRLNAAGSRLRKHVLARTLATSEVTQRRVAQVETDLVAYEAKQRELPSKERDLAALTRRAESFLMIHNYLREKLHEADIAKASTFSHVDIVDDPVPPRTRVSPNLVVNLLIGLFLAILAALGCAFFAEYVDRSFKTPEALEELTGLPLFAALPSFDSVKTRDKRKLKSQMVTIEQPNSVLAEGYRTLRTNVKFADFDTPVRMFAITSAVLGEGKTTTSLNLAVTLAESARVIVVDGDLRRPATHHHLNGKLTPGLTDVLMRGEDWRTVVSKVEGVENLDVIHAGRKPPNPGAALDSKRFADLAAELKKEYEYVIFDVPPVLAVSDACGFFRDLDAVFLLVQWRRCPADVVLAARDQIQRVGAKLRGVIFNGFDARKSGRRGYGRYGYYGYYGGYRRYGYHDAYGQGALDRNRQDAKVSAGKSK